MRINLIFHQTMKVFQDHSPSVSLTVLGTLCFVTLIMCQTRFRISKELSPDFHPPVIRTKDSWFLYSIGNPDRFKCVLKAFIIITSPIISFVSTAFLLLGKVKSNPYYFIPWLFVTIKGLVLIQINNLITIIKDVGGRKNFIFGFRFEDFKWFLFYSSIFMIDLVEIFSFCEIFDLFLVLWNHHPRHNLSSVNLEAVKKEIADIMETLSKCSLGNLSKMSLVSDSDNTSDCNLKKETSLDEISETLKERDIELRGNFSKGDIIPKNISILPSLHSIYENDTNAEGSETDNIISEVDFNDLNEIKQEKLQEVHFQKPGLKITETLSFGSNV